MLIQLLTAATATTSAPSASTDGFDLQKLRFENDALFLLRSTAGSGTMTVTVRIWAYSEVSDAWHPLGVDSTPSNKGVLNGGNAIGETGTDFIAHAEIMSGLKSFRRVYLQVTAIGGTATAISAWLVSRA